ncbi:hypothetical protein HK097_007364 [Rhizophlyctis rosea]|uniref:Uncharacterized protein n=1 Tax=Rhizophlyctis rosea TaxID=64517 RepID=A0AAD5X590_9FUNG|nr:hypothetical protein HK097_007364 [Rhizophlyctis rosea]
MIEKVDLLPSNFNFTGTGRFEYPNDFLTVHTTTDTDHANSLFRNVFYTHDGWPRVKASGVDCEHRTLPGYHTPGCIQAFSDLTAEVINFSCPTLRAEHYPDWLVYYLRDAELLKFGFGVENDVKMLANIGMTGMAGFVRADDIVLWHYRNVAAQTYLGIERILHYGGGGWEVEVLNQRRRKYASIDAQLSLECVREVSRLMTPAQRAEAQKYQAANSYHIAHV